MDLDKAQGPIFGKLPDIIDPRIRKLIESSGQNTSYPLIFQSPINLKFLEKKETREQEKETVEGEFWSEDPEIHKP